MGFKLKSNDMLCYTKNQYAKAYLVLKINISISK